DALGTVKFSSRTPISLSPDGQWIAYTIQDPRRFHTPGDPRYQYFTASGVFVEEMGTDIWLTNLQTGESKNLTGTEGSAWSPAWSPDGAYLAFYSDRDGRARLWAWNRKTEKLRTVSEVTVRPFFGFEVPRWTSDSKRILVKVLPEGMTLEAAADL